VGRRCIEKTLVLYYTLTLDAIYKHNKRFIGKSGKLVPAAAGFLKEFWQKSRFLDG